MTLAGRAAAVGGTLGLLGCAGGQLPPAPAGPAAAAAAAAGSPAFAPASGSPIPLAGSPSAIAVGDVTGDGKLDLLAVTGRDRRLWVLAGTGTGEFRPGGIPPLPLAQAGGDLVLADINVDGRLDLALTSHDSYDVTVMLGDGRGGFRPAPGSPFASKEGQHPHTHGLAVVDLNGDGRLDLATVNSSDQDVSVLVSDGRGGFTRAPGSPFKVGPGPYPLAVGDVDGDGRPDIAVPNTGNGPPAEGRSVTVLLGDGHAGFRAAPGSPFPVAARPYFACLGDVNGDRKADLVVSHDDSSRLTVLLGDGRGGFRPAPGSPLDLGARAWTVLVTDADRDGRMDVLAAAGEGVRVLLGDGLGRFRPAPGSPFPTGRGTWRLVQADLNGDGRLDLATSNLESDTLTVLLGR